MRDGGRCVPVAGGLDTPSKDKLQCHHLLFPSGSVAGGLPMFRATSAHSVKSAGTRSYTVAERPRDKVNALVRAGHYDPHSTRHRRAERMPQTYTLDLDGV